MRTKIVLGVVVLGLAGAGHAVVATDRQVPASASTLAESWRTDDGRTWIDLRPDKTFSASGISNCVGSLGIVDPGTRQVKRIATVADGDGTWSYEPQPGSDVDALRMQFRAPDQPPLWWIVVSVEWHFPPVSVTLSTIDQSPGDPENKRCTLHSP